MSVVSLHLQIRSWLWERAKKYKVIKTRVDNLNSLFFISMPFSFFYLQHWSLLDSGKKDLEIIEGSRSLPSWKSQVDWNEHFIPLGWDFSVEISRVHCWARSELLLLTLDPGDWGTSGSWLREGGRETKIRRQEREAGREENADFSASTAVRGILYAALTL